MANVDVNCGSCGAQVPAPDDGTPVKCMYCGGSIQHVPEKTTPSEGSNPQVENIIKLADSALQAGDYVYIFDGPASLTSTVRGHVGSLVDRGIEMFAEENKIKDTREKEDIQKVGGVNASDNEIAAILSNYPPEENA